MPLSTFNFDKLNSGPRFVWSVLAVACLALAGYCFLTQTYPSLSHEGVDQFQENKIRVQNYLYAEKTPEIAIVGSSMAARLNTNATAITNLALAGGTASTGLEVILRSKIIPKLTIVEVSTVILRPRDTAFLDDLFQPFWHQARRWIPALRETNQPATRLNQWVRKNYGRSENAADLPSELFAFEMQKRRQEFGARNQEDIALLHVNVSFLKGQIEKLQQLGGDAMLLEMPYAEELRDLPFMREVRNEFKRALPNLQWIKVPDNLALKTVDGIHLKKESAKDLVECLRVKFLKNH